MRHAWLVAVVVISTVNVEIFNGRHGENRRSVYTSPTNQVEDDGICSSAGFCCAFYWSSPVRNSR